jgi:hypothetical protein
MHSRVHAPLVAACLATLAGVAALAPAPTMAASDQQVAAAVDAAADWLAARQLPDGSFGVNSGLDPAWALVALAAAGRHAADLRQAPGAPSARDAQLAIWTAADASAWLAGGIAQATDWERAILEARAAGLQPTRLSPSRNLLAGLAPYWLDGWFTSQRSVFNHTLFGLLALDALPVPQALRERVAAVVEVNQHDDGGWTSVPALDPASRARASDVDATGAALAGLCDAGRTLADASVADGIALLRARRAADGSLGNVNATSWALDGMGACGLRRGAIGWTAADETTVDALLADRFVAGPEAGAWGTAGHADPYATADALRALAAAAFAVDPPARLDPADPVVRPAPAVVAGTVVPVALVVDPGDGAPRLCATQAPVGASVAAVLEAARGASQPAGCVTTLVVDDGTVASLDGRGGLPSGGWRASLDGGVESAAGPQAVPFGAVLALRLADPAPIAFDHAGLDAGGVPLGLLGAPLLATLTNASGAPLDVGASRMAGADAGDFPIGGDGCAGETLAPGAACTVAVRFAPSALGARAAVLRAQVRGFAIAPEVALRGEGVPLPAGAAGAPGAAGGARPAGPSGPAGAAGAAGKRGAVGARGPAAQRRVISCWIERRRLRCRLVADARVGRVRHCVDTHRRPPTRRVRRCVRRPAAQRLPAHTSTGAAR